MESLIEESINKVREDFGPSGLLTYFTDFEVLVATVKRGVLAVVQRYKKTTGDVYGSGTDEYYAEIMRTTVINKTRQIVLDSLPAWMAVMIPGDVALKIKSELRGLPSWQAAVAECPFIELV